MAGRGRVSYRWRNTRTVVTLGLRSCVARQESLSPGPYRSFRELSLTESVDPGIWTPPTFVGNSGIEHSNGLCGFALLFLCCCVAVDCCRGTAVVQSSTDVVP